MLIWRSSFELGVIADEFELSSGSPVLQSSIAHSGSNAAKFLGSGSQYIGRQFASSAGTGPYYFRTYFYIGTLPTIEIPIIVLNAASNGSNTGVPQIALSSTGTLKLRNGNTQIGSVSSAISTGGWHYIDILFDRSTASGTNSLRARIDGTEFAGASNLTLSSSIAYFYVGKNFGSTDTAAVLYFDTIGINDSTGTKQNTYLGAGKFIHLLSIAPGDNAQWAAGAGGTANWQRVSESVVDDAATYNKRSTVGTFIDDHTIASGSSGGVGASDTINAVVVGARVGATSTTSTGRTGILRLKTQSGGTVASSPAFGWNVNGWTTNSTTAPKNYKTLTTSGGVDATYFNPQTGLDWTPADLASLQAGYTNGSSSANEIRISTLWVGVDFTPSGGTVVAFTTTHTSDSFLRVSSAKTHTTDALKRLETTKTHTTNSLLRAAVIKTHTTDGYVHASFTKTHTADALLRAINTISHTSNANIRGTFATTYTTNSEIHAESTKTHTTNSYLSNALQSLEINHTTDTLVRGIYTVTHTTLSTLRIALNSSSTTDALLRAAFTITHTSNSLLKVSPQPNHTTDALLHASPEIAHSADSFIRRESNLTHSTDAYIFHPQTAVLTHTTDARIGGELFGDWSAIWDWQIADFTKTHTTDSLLRVQTVKTHTVDSLLKLALTLVHLTDALLKKTNTLTHGTDANISTSHTIDHTADAFILGSIATHLTDTYLRISHHWRDNDKNTTIYNETFIPNDLWTDSAEPATPYGTASETTAVWTTATTATDTWTDSSAPPTD